MVHKSRLPRKVKKKLKKGFWLYQPDKKGNSLHANPHKSQEDFTALKQGIVRNLIDKKNSRKKRIEFNKKIDGEIYITDSVLKEYVNKACREDFRVSAYNTLIEAKDNPKAVGAYFNFINAYNLTEKGDSSFGNICCLAVDLAEKRLKKEYKRNRKSRK